MVKTKKDNQYIEGIGRRKTATARVRITPSEANSIVINDKTFQQFFPSAELQAVVMDSHKASGLEQKFDATVHVAGSGIHSQAEAIRHGYARAILAYDENLKTNLKQAGFIKRDGRKVERKKPGLKKARKAPTWSKR